MGWIDLFFRRSLLESKILKDKKGDLKKGCMTKTQCIYKQRHLETQEASQK